MALPADQQPSQVGTYEKIITIANRIMHGGEITKEEAIELIHTSDDDTMILLAMADKIRQHFNDSTVDICAIVNARSGKCPENYYWSKRNIRTTRRNGIRAKTFAY